MEDKRRGLGEGKYRRCHRNTVVRVSDIGGRGLFATGPIAAGEVVWYDDLRGPQGQTVFSWAQIEGLATAEERERAFMYGYQIGEDEFVFPASEAELDDDAG